MSSFRLESVSWEAPGGRRLLSGIDLSIYRGRNGLVGRNGVGKSTLVRLLAGELELADGRIFRQGTVAWLPQNPKLDPRATVAEVVGIEATLEAIAAVEAGGFSAALYEQIGDDWDLQERARATLDGLGLGTVGLSRELGTLSGGETTRVVLGGLLVGRPGLLALDEPTNHLDQEAREALFDTLEGWTGALLVISHDRQLLGLMDQIVELSSQDLRRWMGGISRTEGLGGGGRRTPLERGGARPAACEIGGPAYS